MNNSYHIKSWCRISSDKIIVDGEVKLIRSEKNSISEFLKEIYIQSEMSYPKFHKMDLLCKAGILAVEQISIKEPLSETDTALVFANRHSSLVSDEKHAQAIFSKDPVASPAVFVYTLPNIVLGEISIRHKLLSENLFLIFERFSPNFFSDYPVQILRENKAEKVLAGWIEVNESKMDVLVFLIEKAGDVKLNSENLVKLYKNK